MPMYAVFVVLVGRNSWQPPRCSTSNRIVAAMLGL
jgi:hypothetical protein